MLYPTSARAHALVRLRQREQSLVSVTPSQLRRSSVNSLVALAAGLLALGNRQLVCQPVVLLLLLRSLLLEIVQLHLELLGLAARSSRARRGALLGRDELLLSRDELRDQRVGARQDPV